MYVYVCMYLNIGMAHFKNFKGIIQSVTLKLEIRSIIHCFLCAVEQRSLKLFQAQGLRCSNRSLRSLCSPREYARCSCAGRNRSLNVGCAIILLVRCVNSSGYHNTWLCTATDRYVGLAAFDIETSSDEAIFRNKNLNKEFSLIFRIFQRDSFQPVHNESI